MLNDLQSVVRLHELEFGLDENARFMPGRAEAEMERCRAELSPAVLSKYKYLKLRYSQSALMETEDGICPGCRISLPRYQNERLRRDMVYCERCGRILYNPELVYSMLA